MTQTLQISIYNKQSKISSASGKPYIARVCIFTPGQAGRLTEADQVGPFYIRDQKGGKQWIRLDADTIGEAKNEALKAQIAMTAGFPVTSPNSEDGQRLISQIAAYLNETEANKARKTWLAYNRSLELFKASCHRANVQDVHREDLLAFKTYLRKQDIGDRAIYNHFLNVSVFFRWAGHRLADMKLTKYDWPAKPERDAEEYSTEEIEALLRAADKDERLLLNAFLNSGLRDGEMAHLTYGDIDPRNSLWSVTPKENHSLKTKESQRVVPVGEWLTQKIMERKAAKGCTNTDLIFPAQRGGVDNHLLRFVKSVAKRAKVGGRVDNHKFRSTAITIWLRDGRTVPEVMAFAGHRSPSTILRYAAKVNLAKKENRQRVTKPFERFNGIGD